MPAANHLKSSRLRIFHGMLALPAAAALLSAVGCSKQVAVTKAQPLGVEVAEVVQKDVPVYREWIGTLDGLVNADIKAEVSGYLTRQDYTEGSFVHKGQLLFQIDPRPFQAALDQAQARLAQSQGQLEQARAQLAFWWMRPRRADAIWPGQMASRVSSVSIRRRAFSARSVTASPGTPPIPPLGPPELHQSRVLRNKHDTLSRPAKLPDLLPDASTGT